MELGKSRKIKKLEPEPIHVTQGVMVKQADFDKLIEREGNQITMPAKEVNTEYVALRGSSKAKWIAVGKVQQTVPRSDNRTIIFVRRLNKQCNVTSRRISNHSTVHKLGKSEQFEFHD